MSSHESDEHVRDAAELRSMNTMDEMRLKSIRLPLLCNNARRLQVNHYLHTLFQIVA